MKEIELKGKFVIAFDTVFMGNQCVMEGDAGTPEYKPALYDSADEAFREIFDSNHSMLQSHLDDGTLEEYNEGVTVAMILDMQNILQSGNVESMRKFMNEHPECDHCEEFVQPADEFILGRKAIFTGLGLVIEGKKLTEL